MRQLMVSLVLALALTVSSGVSAQYSKGEIDIFVLEYYDPITHGLAQPFADQLSQLGHKKVEVQHLRERDVLMAKITGSFTHIDGSQLAIISVDPIAHATYFSNYVTTVALLGRLDLAVFVGEDSDIRDFEDFRGVSDEVVTVGVHSSISQWSAAKIFAELDVPMHASFSYEIREQINMTMTGELDAMVAPHLVARTGLRPIALLSEHSSDALTTASDQGIDVTASYDYLVVAPSGLEQDAYDASNQDIGTMLEENSEFTDTMRELGLRAKYVEGSSYGDLIASQFSALFELQNTFCDTCDCEEDDCKRDCPRCDD